MNMKHAYAASQFILQCRVSHRLSLPLDIYTNYKQNKQREYVKYNIHDL